MRTHRLWLAAICAACLSALALAQQPPATALTLGTAPPPGTQPRLEFAFEERVTLSPVVVLGDTAFGQRQYIPITGGTVAGPKLNGQVVPGGWDYQLGLTNGCRTLTADYFLKANDGTLIRVLNQGMVCPPGGPGERSFFRPVLEAPKGPHEWLTRATFVATLDIDTAVPATAANGTPDVRAIRIRFYQVK
jgi:Protein of unknown function (DUF3237)